MVFCPCPVDERSGVHTEPSGTGPASWAVPGSTGQEAFDSFARPLETAVRNCEIAVKPGDTAWTGVPSKASGAAPMSHGVADASCCGGALRRLPGPRAKDWKPKTAATGRRKAHVFSFGRVFRRPDLSKLRAKRRRRVLCWTPRSSPMKRMTVRRRGTQPISRTAWHRRSTWLPLRPGRRAPGGRRSVD
jgi:hypothetical protein